MQAICVWLGLKYNTAKTIHAMFCLVPRCFSSAFNVEWLRDKCLLETSFTLSRVGFLFLWMCTVDWLHYNTPSSSVFQLFLIIILFHFSSWSKVFFPQNSAPGPRGVVCVVAAGQWAGADRVIIWLVLTPAGILRLWMKRPLWTVKNPLGMLKTHPRHEEPREGRPLQKPRRPSPLPVQSWQSSCSVRFLPKRWPSGHRLRLWTHTGYLHTHCGLLHLRTRAKRLKRYPCCRFWNTDVRNVSSCPSKANGWSESVNVELKRISYIFKR